MMPSGDPTLILHFNQSDETAFTQVYTSLYTSLFLYAQRITLDDEIAKDIVASTFVKLWQMEKQFESILHINHYLRRLIYNASMDHFRQKKVEQKWQATLNQEEEFIEHPSYEEQMETALLQRILAHIESLPAFTQTIFKQAYLEGKSNTQIAEALGIKDQTVRNKKAEALKSLRKQFRGLHTLIWFLG